MVNELDIGSSLEYKLAILTLVNSILAASKSTEDRIHIKGEMIGNYLKEKKSANIFI